MTYLSFVPIVGVTFLPSLCYRRVFSKNMMVSLASCFTSCVVERHQAGVETCFLCTKYAAGAVTTSAGTTVETRATAAAAADCTIDPLNPPRRNSNAVTLPPPPIVARCSFLQAGGGEFALASPPAAELGGIGVGAGELAASTGDERGTRLVMIEAESEEAAAEGGEVGETPATAVGEISGSSGKVGGGQGSRRMGDSLTRPFVDLNRDKGGRRSGGARTSDLLSGELDYVAVNRVWPFRELVVLFE